jgi:hypothetical protein
MVLILFVVLGLAVGLVAGGRLERLGQVRIAWAWLAIGGLAVQIVLFSPQVSGWIGQAGAVGPIIYLGSMAAVLAALLRNLRQPGLAVMALGAALNAAVIVANGGAMPVSGDALAFLGRGVPSAAFTNVVLTSADTALPWLGDVIPLPLPAPFGTAVSGGDLLIGAGAAVFLIRVLTGCRGG